MGAELSHDRLRNKRIVSQSINPFGKNYPASVRADSILRAVPNSKGNELHHNRIVSVYAPYFSGNPQEDLAMVDHLLQRGVPVGNNSINLTATPSTDHQVGPDNIHRFAIENNIQANLKGMQNTPDDGSGYQHIEALRENISKLPYEERIKALDIFVDEIQPALDEKMGSMGYTLPSRQEVADEWTRSVNNEHDLIVSNYNKKELEKSINPNAERFKQIYLENLINIIRSEK